jgi:hypothetical protein
MQVSTHDNLIPAAMQYELADKLRARTVIIPTGALDARLNLNHVAVTGKLTSAESSSSSYSY